ncbi:hypothetical protein GDO81_027166, partial [Engystomops pustulosus]
EEREQSQRIINLVGECLRLLGNALVAVSDLRCNLSMAAPRHMHVVRPMSHYTGPMLLQQAAIPIQINVGTTVTMTGNGSHAGQATPDATPAPTAPASEQPPRTSETPSSTGESTASPAPPAPHPRVIRITHQTVEPVMMMMNIQDSASGASGNIPPSTATHGQQIPGFQAPPPRFVFTRPGTAPTHPPQTGGAVPPAAPGGQAGAGTA